MRHVLRSTLAVVFATSSISAQATILPRNNLHLQDRLELAQDIDEAQFNKIINDIVVKYVPLAQAHGATLKSNNLWTNPTVNASANQSGSQWFINMYGGLARRAEVTPDGFAMVVCHELGHHFGGYSFYGDMEWAAAEGQSDYFATQSCARVAWGDKKAENAAYRTDVNPVVKAKCDAVWKKADEQNLCYRVSKAGESLAALLAALGRSPVPKFETPDTRQVSKTSVAHPQAQCRLDTYFYGALCTKSFDSKIIPGRKHPKGQTGIEAEGVAAANSCMTAQGFKEGARPRCWFKPLVENASLVFSSSVLAEEKGNGNGIVEPGEVAKLGVRLRNGTNALSAGIQAQLVSSAPGVKVVQGRTSFPNIAPGQTVSNAQELLVQVEPNVPCGTSFDLSLSARNQLGAIEVTRSFAVGKVQSALMVRKQVQAGISARGVMSQADAVNAGNVNMLYVKLDIEHANPGDVRVSLRMPNGQTKVIRDRVASRDSLIRETLSIPVPSMPAKGKWSLVVQDSTNGSFGRLNSWELTGASATCAPAGRQLTQLN